jgi:ion channel-forming bestrophin family protein
MIFLLGNGCFSAFRTSALEMDGETQMCATKSNDGWLRTLFVLEGRALDRIAIPWTVTTLNAVVWTLLAELVLPPMDAERSAIFETFFSLVLNTTLAFLLVFRLNRSAERYWIARASWGAVIALGRTITSGVLMHGKHDARNRDDAIRWVATFAISTMQFMRGIKTIQPEALAGILSNDELKELQEATHPPLHAADNIRFHLKELFVVAEDTPLGIAQGRNQYLILVEEQLNAMMNEEGAMERIKSTPLPLVYVTHLRTFLILFLMTMPYVWVPSLGYSTIPLVMLTAFAMLGLDGAAEEVEAPFRKDRTNHLNMDAFCLTLLSNILQQVRQDADREMKLKCQRDVSTINVESNADKDQTKLPSTREATDGEI